MTALPLNVDELLKGQIVESERMEYKKRWNPEDVIHTMCAYANDINNWGGGYIVIGVEEKEGQPIFPPQGLALNKIDAIQKEIVDLRHKIKPHYFPVTVPVKFQEKMIIVIWCPGGRMRPYEALGKRGTYSYYIRRNSITSKVQQKEMQTLFAMANQIPFDDRICHQADLDDIDVGLIKDFLREVKSKLIFDVDKISLPQLCRQMQIAQGPEEYLKPLNIGLMMFSQNPEKFFPCARIEIVHFHDDIGDSFSEKIFKGPIHIQLKEALRYLDSMFIREEVRKRPNEAKTDRFYNYPYRALQEALVNAVYHKDYAQREPIEVRIKPDRIQILSFPGPIAPVTIEDVIKGSADVRAYRNRRIGDFLKELHLTEGRCTGIPKILRAMKQNGSPPPIFQSDSDRLYFQAVLPVHPDAKNTQIDKQESVDHGQPLRYSKRPAQFLIRAPKQRLVFKKKVPEHLKTKIKQLGPRPKKEEITSVICSLCSWKALTAHQLAQLLNKKDEKYLIRRYLTPLVQDGILKYVPSESGNTLNQAYSMRRHTL